MNIAGERVKVTWKPAAYAWEEGSYYATAICVDPRGTLTFEREEDGFLGIAGSGAWVVVR
jgi:hypothetical protein